MKEQGQPAERRGLSALDVTPLSQTGIFAPTGEFWTVGYAGTSVSLRSIKGFTYIQSLLQHPGEELHALDLIRGRGAFTSSKAVGANERELLGDSNVSVRGRGDAGEMLDNQAKQAYKRRLLELKEELEDQQERGNQKRAAEIEAEIDFLAREISRAVGLGGRNRRAGSVAERARLNVTRAIKSALQKISERQAGLGELLDHCVRTGLFCRYVADPRAPISWQFSIEGNQARVEAAAAIAPFTLRSETDFLHAPVDQTTFVGRKEERAAMRRYLEQALRSQGRVLMIGGQPGVGKTRIAKEFGAEAAGRGFLTLAGGCYDREDAVPFSPFVEILETLGNVLNPTAFRAALGNAAAEMARLMPQLRRIFPDVPPPLEMSPDQSRESRRLLFNAFREFLGRNASERPVLLLMEDLQWADEGTLSLLSYLSRSVAEMPVLIVGTYRDDKIDTGRALAQTLDDLIRLHLSERISLRGLPRKAVAEMIQALSGREPPAAVVTLIYSNTEGNPFFVEELFRHLAELGKVSDSDREFWRDFQLAQVDVPHSLRLVIGRRLARLSSETQKILGTAAVIGRSFTFDLLEASTGMDADLLLDRVEEAEKGGLISSTLQFPEARFQFSHELIRKTVLGELSAPRRQRLHLQIAEAIERVYADALEERVNDLAHHLWNAGKAADASKATGYLTTAARQATGAGAYEDALQRLRSALELSSRLEAGIERDRQELELTHALVAALIAARGYASPEIETLMDRMLKLCTRVEDPALRFRIQTEIWSFASVRGDHRARALELSDGLGKMAEKIPLPPVTIWSSVVRGLTFFHLGRMGEAHDALERVVEIYDPKLVPPGTGYQDPGVLSIGYQALALCYLGYPDRAVAKGAEAVKLARDLNDPFSLAFALHFYSAVHQCRREPAITMALSKETIAVSREYKFPLWVAQGMIWHGWALTESGDVENGTGELLEGISAYVATGAQLGITYWIGFLAEAHLKADRVRQAVELLDEAPAVMARGGEGIWGTEIWRLRGEALLRLTDRPAAEARVSLETAIDLARGQGTKLLELRAAMSVARMLMKQGRHREARKMLADRNAWFTEGLDTPDLIECSSLLLETQ